MAFLVLSGPGGDRVAGPQRSLTVRSLPWLSVFLGAIAAICALPNRAIAQSRPATATITPIPCPSALPPGEVEGKTVTCGILTVPENYSQPQGRKIDITYAVLRSRSQSPAPDPVLDLRGGPGGSVIDSGALAVRAQIYQSLRQTRDIVVFDQRGTQFSSQLGCSPVFATFDTLSKDNVNAQRIERAVARMDDGDPLTSEEGLLAYSLCAKVLEAHGADLSQYNSPNSARDAVNLVTALGYNRVNLYGISYGTYLAAQIVREAPDRVRSVILDSVVPMDANKYEFVPLARETVLLNLVADCEQDAACNAAYPTLRARTIALVNRLAETPIPLPADPAAKPGDPAAPGKIDAASMVALVSRLNNDPRLAPYMPRLLHELDQGITTTYSGVVSGKLFTQPSPAEQPPETAQDFTLRAEHFRLEADKLLKAEAELAQTRRPASQWVAQVRSQIAAMPPAAQALATDNLLGVGYLPGKPRDRATLQSFVDEVFPGQAGQLLKARLREMSPIEVRHVYEVIADLTNTVLPEEVTVGMFWSLDCREQVPFGDVNKTNANYNSLQMPALGADLLATARMAYSLCRNWPVEPADPREHQRLETTIPTMVFQSRYDTQTPTYMGPKAIAGLANGRLVEFPNSGHGAIVFSQCAKDIGLSFVDDPQRFPDTSCTASLQPKFVLPSAPSGNP